MGLREGVGRGPLGLDTSIFIYWVEEHPRFASLLEPVFEAVGRGELSVVTSAITMLEVLVQPYRRGDAGLARRFETLLTATRGVELVPVDLPLLRAAAYLRAAVRAKTPDALQLASAMTRSCPCFLTNDSSIPKVPGMTILQLADYAPPPTAVHERPRPRKRARSRVRRRG